MLGTVEKGKIIDENKDNKSESEANIKATIASAIHKTECK